MPHRTCTGSCLLIAATTLVAACSLIDSSRTPVALERLEVTNHLNLVWTAIEDERRQTIRDTAAWAQLWQEMWKDHESAPPLPTVDFERDMVVFVSMGRRPSTGYFIVLEEAFQRDSHIEVRAREVSPGPQCGVGAALTHPVDLARIPRSDQPVHFEVRSRVHRCR